MTQANAEAGVTSIQEPVTAVAAADGGFGVTTQAAATARAKSSSPAAPD